MQLVKQRPGRNPLQCATNSDRFFEGFFDDLAAPFFHRSLATPKVIQHNLNVDIYEKDNVIIVDADMPGISKEDIHLDVKGKILTFGYERKDENEIKDEQLYRRERRYGKFERTFSMPFEIDADKVTAKYENGVLKLEILKPEQQQKKQIEIK